MHFRHAETRDIGAMFAVRMSVKENILVNISLVTDEICEDYINRRGKGWVCEIDGNITGFAIADLEDNSVWALFVRPEYEGRGIGKQLHDLMLKWYFETERNTIWLTTAADTRAASFYKAAGWEEKGTQHGEIRFELTAGTWRRHHNPQ